MAVIPCAWTRARLGLFVGDDLIGPERREVERHLIGCAKCRTQLKKHEESLAVLRLAALEAPSLSEGVSVWPGLDRQIREARHSAPTSWGWTRAATALAAMIALASLVVLAPRSPLDPNPDQTATVAERSTNAPAPDDKKVEPRVATLVQRTEAPRAGNDPNIAPRVKPPKTKVKTKVKTKTDPLVAKARAKDDSERSNPARTEVEALAGDRDTH